MSIAAAAVTMMTMVLVTMLMDGCKLLLRGDK